MWITRAPHLLLLLATGAFAQQPVDAIGVVAPLSGPEAILGEQLLAGARAGAGGTALVEADDACSTDGGARAAAQMRERGVKAVVGFLCTAALEAAMPILSAAGIPVIDVGVRTDRLLKRRETDHWPLWRIAPGSGDEAAALVRFVRERWQGESVGLIEDGTAGGRDLADRVRETLEGQGYRFALVDNYRPAEEKQFALARRIAASGVTHLLILGSRPDIAVIARDAAELKLDLRILGGEALVDASRSDGVPLAEGVMAVASGRDTAWAPAETAAPNEGYAFAGRVGAEIARDALAKAQTSGRSVETVLGNDALATESAGPVRFGADGAAAILPFRAYRWTGDRFQAEDEG